MRYSFLAPALALAFASSVFADADASPSDVLSLTAADFDDIVNPEPLILVEFFAPWCGHCKALAPHYEEAATELKEKNIKLAKVDCVDQADLCQANGIGGYPTLRVYKNGEHADYNGPRKADGIVAYMTKQSLPAVSTVTAENHVEFQSSDKVVAIAYVSDSSDPLAVEFTKTAEAHRDDYLFGQSSDPQVIASLGISAPALIVYRSFDAPSVEYPYPIASATPKDIAEWLAELAIPVIDEVNGDNYAVYAQSQKPLAYLFLDPSDEGKDAKLAEIKPVAEAFKSKVNFVWIDAVKFGDHGKALNLQEAKWPSFVVQDLEKQLKYPYDQGKEVSAAAVEDWVQQYLDGKLTPELKSEPIPESQDESVFTLVGKQFDEVVFDDSKDVFVEFYATWCGHCKRLKPTWDNLADHFASQKDKILIAKMEATENDLPPSVPFRVQGFPTLKFKPAGGREWLDYEGDRGFDSLVAYVTEHAKNDLTEVVVPEEEPAQVPLGGASENTSTTPESPEHNEL
ncbi:protein disulfide isomerase [Armillaria novae-zelandiae]|uniref:Protein disulfide-isomerase n=1 Tax=Armillaria novae-zelandiae TaxID=153914 RepID=A0AA39PV09_9AGAR|nr:protein disulfide isomerase [Armillaria novae-zelandiae]